MVIGCRESKMFSEMFTLMGDMLQEVEQSMKEFDDIFEGNKIRNSNYKNAFRHSVVKNKLIL